MRKEPGRGVTQVRSQEVELGQRPEPWPVTLMSYGDTPRPCSTGGGHGHGLRTESSRWSHSQSGGWQGPAPSYPQPSTRRAWPGPCGPEVSDETWEATLTGSPGGGLSPGTLSENTAVAVTACPALTPCRALWGLPIRPPASLGPHWDPHWEEGASGPFYRRGNGGSGCTSR